MKSRYIDDFLKPIYKHEIPASAEMLKLVDYVDGILKNSDVTIDNEKAAKAIQLMEKYFKYQLFPWEKFDVAMMFARYKSDNTLVFTEHFMEIGRGNGKNGFISPVAWYLTTKYHGINGYNVDIIANSEDQAKTSFDDVYSMLEETQAKSHKWFTWNKTEIVNKNTNSYIRYNTSNPKTKDGKRSGCLIADEIHAYENSAALRTFESGFGKRPDSRTFTITTNGYVRDGVLDKKLKIAEDVLDGKIKMRMLPMIFKIDDEEEADDPANWIKANPSLPYLPNLKIEMENENTTRKIDADVNLEFMTKRMNLPKSDMEIAVTQWDNIAATNKPLPDLTGWACTVGIDFAKINDWAAVDFHFKHGHDRLDINHSFMCSQSADLARIRAPWREWANAGLLTVVDDVEIGADRIVEYVAKMIQQYHLSVKAVAVDSFRYALLSNALSKIGFSAKEYKNVKLVRPSDIMKVQVVINSCFNNQYFVWGDNPPLRWAVNNTKLVRSGRTTGTDTGNFYYAKIEAKSRKTDPFMALVAAMTIEEYLDNVIDVDSLTVFAPF
ncbi:MAG: terminase large subunit domain-containing protein [Pseudoramibacter sp.]